MNSLKELIKTMSTNKSFYYSNQVKRPRFDSFKQSQSSTFISEYFNIAGKGEVVKKVFFLKTAPNKDDHAVSAYFIGAWLATKLGIKGKLRELAGNRFYSRNFLFIWFLACLYHDKHFALEKKPSSKYNGLKDLKQQLRYYLLDHKPIFIPKNLYSVIDSYFQYRLQHFSVNDHGISGGLHLFNDLVENRLVMEDNHAGNEKMNLNFSESIEKYYLEAAYAVATHNIFFPKPSDSCLYKKYNLDNLIGHRKISYAESPFLFLLGLVDTIEPIKTFSSTDADLVAGSVSLGFEVNPFKLLIKVCGELDFTDLRDKTKGIDNWLDVDVEYDQKEGLIIISLQKT